MKYLFAILIAVISLLPAGVLAEEPDGKTWNFRYRFDLRWQDGELSLPQRYHITTGEVPALPYGEWTLRVLNSLNETITQHAFSPELLDDGGDVVVIIPAEDSGTTAQFINGEGVAVLVVNLTGSRVCNDNTVCEADVGERLENCPRDCGAVAVRARDMQSAAIAPQLSVGVRLGEIASRLGYAAVGMLLLFGAARMLDSRNRP